MDKENKSFEILFRENSRMLTVFLTTRIREQAVVDDLIPGDHVSGYPYRKTCCNY